MEVQAMGNLTVYQQQRKGEREYAAMQARCAEIRDEERRLTERLRVWTKAQLGKVDRGLTAEDFSLLAHNWYLTSLNDAARGPAFLAQAKEVKQVMDRYESLGRLIWRRAERLTSLALRQLYRS